MRPSRCSSVRIAWSVRSSFICKFLRITGPCTAYYCTTAPAREGFLQLSAPPKRYPRPHQQQPAPTGGAVMRIGVPKEIKVHEYRIGLVPAAARELVEAGHEVTVQTGGASGIGFSDADYQRV